MPRQRKVDVVSEIAELLHVPTPRMSTGSTEPKQIFDLVNERLGLGIPEGTTKPEVARAIVESSGEAWSPMFESSGGTVTLDGLVAVRGAVRFFLGSG